MKIKTLKTIARPKVKKKLSSIQKKNVLIVKKAKTRKLFISDVNFRSVPIKIMPKISRPPTKSAFVFWPLEKMSPLTRIGTSVLLCIIFTFSVVQAATRTVSYTPGETLDPDCLPGEDFCDVVSTNVSFVTASTTNLVMNGQSFNNLLGDGLSNVGGTLTVSGAPVGSISLAKGNFLVGNDLGTAQATSSIFVSSTGNIGIGTTGPLARLSLGATLGTNLYLYDSGTAATSLGIGVSSASFNLFTDTSASDFNFKAGGSTGTNLVTIKGTGNVGIGTTGPSQLLGVAGNGYFTGALGVGGVTVPQATLDITKVTPTFRLYDTGNNALLTVTTGGGNIHMANVYSQGSISLGVANFADQVWLDKSGNVGIGTTSPSQLLTVGNNNQFTVDSSGNVRLRNTALGGFDFTSGGGVPVLTFLYNGVGRSYITGNGGNGYDISLNAGNNGNVILNPNGTGNIQMNGNVGIGTTAPGKNLSVVGSIAAGESSTSDTDGRVLFRWDAAGDYGDINSYQSGYKKLQIDGSPLLLNTQSTGNVGIGSTSPVAKLSVKGGGTTTGLLAQFADSADTARVTILDNGNVGIGTTGPVNKVEIQGNTTGVGGTGSVLKVVQNGGWSGNNPYALEVVGYSNLGGFRINGSVGVRGIYQTGDGTQLDFASNNGVITFTNTPGGVTERMRIDINGNIGIGTTNPGAQLDILSNKGIGGGLSQRVLINSATNQGYFGVDGTGAGGSTDKIYFGGSGASGDGFVGSANNLQFQTAYSTRLYIQSGGNVGIGSTSPVAKLSVKGGGTTTGLLAQFADSADTARVTILDNGNVGIGTTAPTGLLSLYKSTGTILSFDGAANIDNYIDFKEAGASYFRFLHSASAGASPNNLFTIQSASGSGGAIDTNIMTFKQNGNVGIGTTGPAVKLDIQTADGNNWLNLGGVQAANSVGKYITFLGGTSGATTRGYVGFGKNGSGAATIFTDELADSFGIRAVGALHLGSGAGADLTIDTNGNVGIGSTVPTYKLTVNGSIGLLNSNNNGSVGTDVWGNISLTSDRANLFALILEKAQGSQLYMRNGGTSFLNLQHDGTNAELWNYQNGYLRFGVNNAEAARFNSSGNFGIGTTSPWTKLSVNGSVAMPGLVNDSTGYYVCLNTTSGQMATSTTACGASSIKFKENIEPLSYGLNEVLALNPVFFQYKEEYMKDRRKQLGFIAEEVDQIIPELVAKDSAGEIQGLDYPKFTAVLVKAIQELNTKLDGILAQIKGVLAWFNDGKMQVQNDICVNNTCITKDQFEALILKAGVGATQYTNPLIQSVIITATSTATSTAEITGEKASSTPEVASSTPEIIAPEILPDPSQTATSTEEITPIP